ncbi:YciI family protein [Leifsonia sp. EB34]|uniref:YciI family protein n=1 Tax=Leifsonia sp. EB34 TaxID=3156303 RepID=UPI00351724FE
MTGYLILIYGDESRWDALDEDARAAVDDAHRAFNEKAGEGVRAAGELQASSTATTLRTGPDGEPRPTDGPFSESKEVVGGFYLIEAESQEAAVALAASLAEARQGHGGIEVRPLVGRG